MTPVHAAVERNIKNVVGGNGKYYSSHAFQFCLSEGKKTGLKVWFPNICGINPLGFHHKVGEP